MQNATKVGVSAREMNPGEDMGVSENSGTPKSSILIGFSIINHPFRGTPIFGNTHITRFYPEVDVVMYSGCFWKN